MIVLDRTGSMCQPCSKMTNARGGRARFPLGDGPADRQDRAGRLPAGDERGRRVHVAADVVLRRPVPSVRRRAAVFGLSHLPDRAAERGSQLVQTTNCLSAGGITSYATALDQAQNELSTTGRSYAQDVIVFFTDGEANYGPSYYGNTSSYRTRPCGQAIGSASTMQSAGTWIYGIVYDTNQSTRCKGWKASPASCAGPPAQAFTCDESPTITAYSAVQQIVADPTRFFYQPIPGDSDHDLRADRGRPLRPETRGRRRDVASPCNPRTPQFTRRGITPPAPDDHG